MKILSFLITGLLAYVLVFGGYFVLGVALYCLGLRKLGHYLVGVSGFGSRWLETHCPYVDCRVKCLVWTCPAYCTKCERNGSHL